MNYVVWWHYVMDNYICVIDDYRTCNVYLHIYLSQQVKENMMAKISQIFTCSHTLVAPHGLQNLGGVSILIYASDVLMIIIEIQIHCIY